MSEEVRLRRPCPRCGRELVERTNRTDGSPFLGCSGYAERDPFGKRRCEHTEGLPEDLRLRRLGAAALPGFE